MDRRRIELLGAPSVAPSPRHPPGVGVGVSRRRAHLNTQKLFAGPTSVPHLISLATNWGLVSLDFLPEGRRKRHQALTAWHEPDKGL